jgi:hypothetical protein
VRSSRMTSQAGCRSSACHLRKPRTPEATAGPKVASRLAIDSEVLWMRSQGRLHGVDGVR